MVRQSLVRHRAYDLITYRRLVEAVDQAFIGHAAYYYAITYVSPSNPLALRLTGTVK